MIGGLAAAAAALMLVYGVELIDRAMSRLRLGGAAQVLAAPLTVSQGDRWTVEALHEALARRGIPEATARQPGRGDFAVLGDRIVLGDGLCDDRGGRVLLSFAAGGVEIRNERGEAIATLTVRPAVVGTTTAADTEAWWVPIDRVSPEAITAVVDLEDPAFLAHGGLSFRGLLRAALRDLVSGGVREGGSTITQQLAKVLLLRPEREVSRKLFEAWLASLIEFRYGKRTILEAYLNGIYLGQDGGRNIRGVGAAAQYYFGKRVDDLGVSEAALLAALIAAPNRFDPFAHPDAARERRGLTLAAMVREGHLTATAAEAAAQLPLPAVPHRLR